MQTRTGLVSDKCQVRRHFDVLLASRLSRLPDRDPSCKAPRIVVPGGLTAIVWARLRPKHRADPRASFAPLRSESVVLLVQSETGRWSRILRTRIWGQVNTWYLLNPAMGQAACLQAKSAPQLRPFLAQAR